MLSMDRMHYIRPRWGMFQSFSNTILAMVWPVSILSFENIVYTFNNLTDKASLFGLTEVVNLVSTCMLWQLPTI